MSEEAQNRKAAELFMEFFLSVEGQTIVSEAMGGISSNADVSSENLSVVKQKIAEDVFGDPDARLIVRFWEATLGTIGLPACAAFDKFVLDPDSYMDVIAELDELSIAAWAEFEAK